MTKLLYFRLACRNLRRGRQTYLPFLIASSLLTFALYSFSMITFNPGISLMRGSEGFTLVMNLGLVVVGLFTAVFLFYANSFLIRRRKKELGLYSILGMEKKHVVRVLRHELFLCWGITLIFGLGLGMLLARLLFLFIRALCRMEITLSGSVNPQALVTTLILTTALFLLLFLYNAFQVRLQNPVELLRGQQVSEKEPKARWILAVLGVVCMGGGYVLAQIVSSPMAAVALFFIAVLLVIAGTYLLFLTGSVALLKLLKKKRSFYYSPRHFVTVSGMLYRMKQNAAGLASIAILCTMAMITVGTTAALYFGSEDMLDAMYPSDICVGVEHESNAAQIIETAQEVEKASPVQPVDRHVYRSRSLWTMIVDGRMDTVSDAESLDSFSKLYVGELFTLEDWNALQGTSLTLGGGEVGWYGDPGPDTLEISGSAYRVKRIDKVKVIPARNVGSAYNTLMLVVRDEHVAQDLSAQLSGSALGYKDSDAGYTVQWNLSGGTEQERAAYTDAVLTAIKRNLLAAPDDQLTSISTANKPAIRTEWYAMHGGFLFVGLFLGVIFLMGTALIIYFKQISEGYQDHDRYIILQKVGMSRDEVKATVGRQILIVFFLPILVAVLHVAGSLHMMILMLRMFGLTNIPYITLCTFASAMGVALLYLIFYWRTAKAYFRLVRF